MLVGVFGALDQRVGEPLVLGVAGAASDRARHRLRKSARAGAADQELR